MCGYCCYWTIIIYEYGWPGWPGRTAEYAYKHYWDLIVFAFLFSAFFAVHYFEKIRKKRKELHTKKIIIENKNHTFTINTFFLSFFLPYWLLHQIKTLCSCIDWLQANDSERARKNDNIVGTLHTKNQNEIYTRDRIDSADLMMMMLILLWCMVLMMWCLF